MGNDINEAKLQPGSGIERIIAFFLQNKLVTFLWVMLIIISGIYVMPFDYFHEQRSPIHVDAIPDIGEMQVIVFTEWPGRSPQDIEDQVTYPLTISLQGIPGVKEVRSFSVFGFSSSNVIFHDDVDFYWARSRVLEKLDSARRDLPAGVVPALGPDATALGQVFWYTLEGEGFDLEELRSIQDWYVRYALQGVEGVSEVASIGGYVRQYQVDVSPEAMRHYGVMLGEVVNAVARSNIDVGAHTIEHSGVEYMVRGIGFIQSLEDIENIVIKLNNDVPVYIKDVADVVLGPAPRRGVLDKSGVEAVGGIVTARYGENPLAVINRVKERIEDIEPGLPRKMLPDGAESRVEIVPFYDRTELIYETLGTLEDALILQVLITSFVVFLMLNAISGSFAITVNVPLGILLTFGLMKIFGIESNLMSLGGIAISIGAMVDMAVILYENSTRQNQEAPKGRNPLLTVFNSSREVAGAIATAIATTVISFLPVFALLGSEGKLFHPLAWTKTFALIASITVALTVTPAIAHIIFKNKPNERKIRLIAVPALFLLGLIALSVSRFFGILLVIAAIYYLVVPEAGFRFGKPGGKHFSYLMGGFASLLVVLVLVRQWMPLGYDVSFLRNMFIVLIPIAVWVLLALLIIPNYSRILGALLRKKALFLMVPVLIVVLAANIWLGFGRVFSFMPGEKLRETRLWRWAYHEFPGLGSEFMPSLHEGAFLWMPVTMPHASIGEVTEIMQAQDLLFEQIHEVDFVVGKLGRAESPLDPAPLNMIETIIFYHPEYGPPDPETGVRERLWRDHIRSHLDIWDEIQAAGAMVPGSTSAPRLGPIETRIVMLQTGMRAPMGVKVYGENLQALERATYDIASLLEQVPGINPQTVVPDRVVGKPYLEIIIDREKIALYGLRIGDVQDVIGHAVGGMPVTYTVEGRERYPVRVRYQRELRDSPEAIKNILIPAPGGIQVPLEQVAEIKITAGPMVIKSEDTFQVAYITFDRSPDVAEVEVVERAQAFLTNRLEEGELVLPPGVYYKFAGAYEQQLRFQRTLSMVLPLSLFLIFMLLYFQFRSVPLTLITFSQLFCVWGGAFVGLYLVSQGWFLNFSILGVNLRELYNLRAFYLSVPVWVGFLALFGIATDDAVVTSTYIKQLFEQRSPGSIAQIRELVIEGAQKRIRPCFMTTITTAIALVPILTSIGRGSEVMMPMTIPIISGMTVSLLTLYITPVLVSALHEHRFRKGRK